MKKQRAFADAKARFAIKILLKCRDLPKESLQYWDSVV